MDRRTENPLRLRPIHVILIVILCSGILFDFMLDDAKLDILYRIE